MGGFPEEIAMRPQGNRLPFVLNLAIIAWSLLGYIRYIPDEVSSILKVLVTGSLGYLGGALCKALLDRGDEVIGIARGITRNIPSISLALGDITNYGFLLEVISNYRVEEVYHLAAMGDLATRHTLETYRSNVWGTVNILEAALHGGAQRLVLTSSWEAYGTPRKVPIDEDHPLLAEQTYGLTKAIQDSMTQNWGKEKNFPAAILRPSRVFGPGDLHMNRLIPSLIRDTIKGKNPELQSDGNPTADYLYIDDAIAGHLAAMDWLRDNESKTGEAFNLSTGIPTSEREIAEDVCLLAEHRGLKPIIKEVHSKADIRCLSNHKAHDVLGWTPMMRLESGLKETYRWYQDYLLRLENGTQ